MKCQHCNGEMCQTQQVNKDYGLQSVGCLVGLVGIMLMWFFPLGTICGIILLILAARMGYSQKPVWKCQQCGFFFEYAK